MTPFPSFRSFSAVLLPAALNHLLDQEAWARARLTPHAGKIACFEVGPVTLALQVTGEGLVDAAPAGEAATVTIRVRSADLPLIAQNRDRAFSYVKIDGDADFANTISQISQSLRWEVADDLGRVAVASLGQRLNRCGARHRAILRGHPYPR